MECHHRTERAVRLARHVCYRLMGVLRPHEEHEVAVQPPGRWPGSRWCRGHGARMAWLGDSICVILVSRISTLSVSP